MNVVIERDKTMRSSEHTTDTDRGALLRSHGLSVRKYVDNEHVLKPALAHIGKYSYRYRQRRIDGDKVQSPQSLGVTLASAAMIVDAAELSETMRSLNAAELRQGLEYVVSSHPLEVAVTGLGIMAQENGRLAVLVKSEELSEEMQAVRKLLFSFLPENNEATTAWWNRYRNNRPHISLATLDKKFPPSQKMLDEVKEKLPEKVTLEPTSIHHRARVF